MGSQNASDHSEGKESAEKVSSEHSEGSEQKEGGKDNDCAFYSGERVMNNDVFNEPIPVNRIISIVKL